MITAVTPTGDRPLAFALCRRWIQNQRVKPDQWIVVDDGKEPIADTSGFEYVRRDPGPEKNTLALNLRAAVPKIQGDKILIIEDDEYYAPGYVEAMSRQLEKAETVGIGKSRYYHLPTGGYMVIGNGGHASLAQTGFRKSFLSEFRKLLTPGKLYIDFAIWQRAKARKSALVFLDDKNPLYVGMKGLPGRAGIGRGHDSRIYRQIDRGRQVLRRWIPRDYQIYLDLLEKRSA